MLAYIRVEIWVHLVIMSKIAMMIMCSRFLLSSVLLTYSCSAQIEHQSRNKSGSLSCPLWSFYDEKSKTCDCFNHRLRCTGDGAYFKAGYCVTYDDNTRTMSNALCPYFQSNGFKMTMFHDHYWYIPMPENLSELNDYMCGAMSRKGRVCSRCADGFGPAVMSVGFQIQCSQCIGAWYGIPLYLFLELCPVTIFYLILLIFQINITSAPMTSYIMYSQIIVLTTDRIFSLDMPVLTGVMFSLIKFLQWSYYLCMIFGIFAFFATLCPPFALVVG